MRMRKPMLVVCETSWRQAKALRSRTAERRSKQMIVIRQNRQLLKLSIHLENCVHQTKWSGSDEYNDGTTGTNNVTINELNWKQSKIKCGL